MNNDAMYCNSKYSHIFSLINDIKHIHNEYNNCSNIRLENDWKYVYEKFMSLLENNTLSFVSMKQAIENGWGKFSFDHTSILKLFKYWIEMDSCTTPKKCLLVVDVQNDFLTGSLSTQDDHNNVVRNINKILRNKAHNFEMIVYSRDWHPQNHISFYDNVHLYSQNNVPLNHAAIMYNTYTFQLPEIYNSEKYEVILWPVHCVQNTKGAKFSPDLYFIDDLKNNTVIINKGTNPILESFSVFQDTLKIEKTPLLNLLLDNCITDVYICGCDAEFCVSYTAVDSIKFCFSTYIIKDATLYVDCKNKSYLPCQELGVKIISIEDI